jgi:tRNA(Ile)-lysidine synthase TilS/MesJ
VPYRILEMDLNPDEPRPLPCYRCTWHRRKALFIAADESGYRTVAYGHHRDDRAATALLGLLFAGRLESLPARRDFFGGRIRLVRPLILVPEKEIARFARAAGFPDLGYRCPQAQKSRRAFVKRLLEVAVRENPRAVANIVNAIEEIDRLRGQNPDADL